MKIKLFLLKFYTNFYFNGFHYLKLFQEHAQNQTFSILKNVAWPIFFMICYDKILLVWKSLILGMLLDNIFIYIYRWQLTTPQVAGGVDGINTINPKRKHTGRGKRSTTSLESGAGPSGMAGQVWQHVSLATQPGLISAALPSRAQEEYMDTSSILNFIPDMLVIDQAKDGQGLPNAQEAQNQVQWGQGNHVHGVFTAQNSQ